MQSANTLKHNIVVSPSTYAALLVFALYGSVILLLLLLFNISFLTFPFYLLLLIIALYGARQAYRQIYYLKVSDSGRIEVIGETNRELINGVICTSSFYNAFFLSLHIKCDDSDFSNPNYHNKISLAVYRDAVSDADYRLLARLINVGRD